ncbi:hypothetical protein COO60DRAFT_1639694 [Scenedesmus sp. NREL 46B-D3]|nr:hypothetical protein COO60DRAFT_1639694 [Scenedesmus sp. NREL 46B-D3]
MAELANPERYTHCVIRDMQEKYPDLELNMGQIRKIKFRTLGNINPRQGSAKPPQQQQQQQAAGCCSFGFDGGMQVQAAAAAAATGGGIGVPPQHVLPAAVLPAAAAAAAAGVPGAAAVDFAFAGLGDVGMLPGQVSSSVKAANMLAAAAADHQAELVPAAAGTAAPAAATAGDAASPAWEGGAELHRASVQAVNCAVTGLWFCVCLAQGVSGDGKKRVIEGLLTSWF